MTLLITGTIAVLSGMVWYVYNLQKLSSGTGTIGTISGYQETLLPNGAIRYHPMVTFTTSDHHPITTRLLQRGNGHKSYQIGQQVYLIYLPSCPETIIRQNFWMISRLPIGLSVLGIALYVLYLIDQLGLVTS